MNLPKLHCKGLCHQSCGPIAMSRAEYNTLRDIVGEKLQCEFWGDMAMVTNFDRTTLACPLLTVDKRCSVYEHRPMLCRIWGMVKAMKCPFGCRPSRWLSDAECLELLR